MQAISPRQQRAPVGRNLGYFLIPPLVGLALLVLVLGLGLSAYRAQHSGRVYTGVTVQGLDLSEMTVDEAQAALAGALPYAGAATVTLVDPASGDEWPFAPAQLGIAVDATATAAAAFDVGRSGGPLHRLQDTCLLYTSWEPQRTYNSES